MVAKHDHGAKSSATVAADDPDGVDTAMQQMIASVEECYLLREPEQVRSFLAAHPEVLDLVIEAAVKIPEFLPVDRPVELRLIRDLDDGDVGGDLSAIVSTRREPGEVEPLIERLDRGWLIPAVQGDGLRFNVGIEYR